MQKRQAGFTLVEMLVVIAIIGILGAALLFSFTPFLKSSKQARATEAVSNARTALEGLYLRENKWPSEFIKSLKDSKCQFERHYVMGEAVAKVFAQRNALSVDYRGGSLQGKDRCGIVDPWAGDVLEKAPAGKKCDELLELSVPSGGKVKDHYLHFAVDVNGDGKVSVSEGAPAKDVRAKAIVWCAGADGVLGDEGAKAASDNVYSWQRAQEVR